MKVFRTGSTFELYGHWDALVAETPDGVFLGATPAHDGDFFPESPLDHAEVLREAILRSRETGLQQTWPVRVDIDITQVCNCRCAFCYSEGYGRQQAYRASVARLEDLAGLLQELAEGGTRTIRFTGGGEPLTHPEIHEILQLPGRHGMSCCLLTNGDLLDERLADCIFSHVDHLRWSVNAFSDETRRRLHRPRGETNTLPQTSRLIQHLIRRREHNRPGQRRPMVWATFLVLPDNYEEIVPAARMLQHTGVDSVSFRPPYHGLGGEWTPATLDQAETMLRQVSELDHPPRFRVFTPKRRLDEACHLYPAEHFSHCIGRRTRTVVEVSNEGFSLKTCGLFRGSGPAQEFTLGKERSFSDVWRSHQAVSDLAMIPPDCRVCIDVSMNTALEFIWTTLSKHPDAVFFRASHREG